MHVLKNLGRQGILSLVLAAILVIPLNAKEIIRKSFAVKPGGTLLLDTERGSVTVTTAKQNKVSVEITLSDRRGDEREVIDAFEISFDHRGDDVAIEAEFRSAWRKLRARNNLRIRYEITVPERYNVDIKTVGGDIRVANLIGDVTCSTSGGDLEFGNIDGTVRGRTSGGDISLKASAGVAEIKTSGGDIYVGRVESRVQAMTSGGSITIERAKGPVVAKTSGGNITVEDVSAPIEAKTSGGSIRAYFTRQPKGESNLVTSGGNISVRLAPGLNVDIEAKAGGGSVSTNIPVTVQGKLSKRKIVGIIGSGGPLLYLKTSGGSIRLSELN